MHNQIFIKWLHFAILSITSALLSHCFPTVAPKQSTLYVHFKAFIYTFMYQSGHVYFHEHCIHNRVQI